MSAMTRIFASILIVILFAFRPTSVTAAAAPNGGRVLQLREGWAVQSSCKVGQTGEEISSRKFVAKGWHGATVPSTVLAALVADKAFADPYFGMNLRSIPGTGYPPEKLFSRLPMPDDSPFKCSWWYRTEFRLPRSFADQNLWLNFQGINYRANVWINGKRIAESNTFAGAYRSYELNVTDYLDSALTNILAVEVFAPTEKDLAINWVDWNPTPPDKNMGLWRGVYLSSTGPVSLRYPQVTSHVVKDLTAADLTVSAEVRSTTDHAIVGTLDAEIGNIRLQQNVELAPNESKLVTFTPEQYPELKLSAPRLWWPYQMGTPYLYTMKMRFRVNGRLSDEQTVRFGIREVTSELTDKGHRLFRINGKKILIRGGGWAPDMLLRDDRQRREAELRYVRHMNLNTIRLEGKMETDEFYDMADRYGILIMAGWCCCDIWEEWKDWPQENHNVAVESLKSQILQLRNHPSVFVWLNGSDNPPPPEVEQAYLDVLQQLKWPNPVLSSATQQTSTVTGPTGVKMTGPYDWIPPSYWLTDTKNGGAWGFNTETGPGPSVPTAESLRKFIPAEHLWPIDEYWNYHAGLEGFTNIGVFRNAMEVRYGSAASMEDFAARAQALAYDGERAMFEAYSRNKYTSTGVIQWMLNKSWPSLIWQLYDYYLMPNGAFFGAKKALEPLHVQYSYDDRSVYVVNSTYGPMRGVTVSAKVLNFDLSEKYSMHARLDVDADSSNRVFDIPALPDLSTTHFVKLDLHDREGKLLSTNFYWLSTKTDVFDWAKTDYRLTPVSDHGDLTALGALPKAGVVVASRTIRGKDDNVTRVTVRNAGASLAFMVRLRLTKGAKGDDVLPILWDDNYFTLLPGEEREVSAHYAARDLGAAIPVIQVEGWNTNPNSSGRTEATAN